MKTLKVLIPVMFFISGCDITTQPVLAPPVAPSDLELVQISTSEIQLYWYDNSDDEEGFRIDRRIGDGVWEENLVELAPNTESWLDVNAVENEINEYCIYAFGLDTLSIPVINTIVPRNPDPRPLAPTNLQLEQVSPMEVRLTWQDNCSWEVGFQIDRRIGTEAWADNIADIGANVETWLDTEAIPEASNTYRIWACGVDSISTTLQETIIPVYPAPMISLSPSDQELGIGEKFTLSIDIKNFRVAYFGVSLELEFDNEKIEFLQSNRIALGDVWTTAVSGMTKNQPPIIPVYIHQSSSVSKPSMAGSLTSLRFRTMTAGVASIDMLAGDLIFYDETGDPLSIPDLEIVNASILINE